MQLVRYPIGHTRSSHHVRLPTSNLRQIYMPLSVIIYCPHVGCHVDYESDMTTSSYSAGMHSSIFTDDMDRSWSGDQHPTSKYYDRSISEADHRHHSASSVSTSDVRITVADLKALPEQQREAASQDTPFEFHSPGGGTATSYIQTDLAPKHADSEGCDQTSRDAMPAAAADCRPSDADVELLVRDTDSLRIVATGLHDERKLSSENRSSNAMTPDSKEADEFDDQFRHAISGSLCNVPEMANGKVNGKTISTKSASVSFTLPTSATDRHATGLQQTRDVDQLSSSVTDTTANSTTSTMQKSDIISNEVDDRNNTKANIGEQIDVSLIKEAAMAVDKAWLEQNRCNAVCENVVGDEVDEIARCAFNEQSIVILMKDTDEKLIAEENLPLDLDRNDQATPCPVDSEQSGDQLNVSTVVEQHHGKSMNAPMNARSTASTKSPLKKTQTSDDKRELTEHIAAGAKTKHTSRTTVRTKEVTSSVNNTGRSMPVGQKRSTDETGAAGVGKVANVITSVSKTTSATRTSTNQKQEQRQQHSDVSTVRSRTRVTSVNDADDGSRRTTIKSATTTTKENDTGKLERSSERSVTASSNKVSKNTRRLSQSKGDPTCSGNVVNPGSKEKTNDSIKTKGNVTDRTINLKNSQTESVKSNAQSADINDNGAVLVTSDGRSNHGLTGHGAQEKQEVESDVRHNDDLPSESNEAVLVYRDIKDVGVEHHVTVAMTSDSNATNVQENGEEEFNSKTENISTKVNASNNRSSAEVCSSAAPKTVTHSRSTIANSRHTVLESSNHSPLASKTKMTTTNPANNTPGRRLTTESSTPPMSNKERITKMSSRSAEKKVPLKADIVDGSVASRQKPQIVSDSSKSHNGLYTIVNKSIHWT